MSFPFTTDLTSSITTATIAAENPKQPNFWTLPSTVYDIIKVVIPFIIVPIAWALITLWFSVNSLAQANADNQVRFKRYEEIREQRIAETTETKVNVKELQEAFKDLKSGDIKELKDGQNEIRSDVKILLQRSAH